MNEDTLVGSAKTVFGKLESAAGDALGDHGMQAGGAIRQVEGKTQDALGSAEGVLSKVADQAKGAASMVSEKATDAYGRAADRVQSVRDQVDPFVAEKPYAALGIAAAVGLLTGLLFAGRGPKVVYVRPHA